MKPRLLSAVRLSFPLASAIAALLAGQSAQGQTTRYWDGNNNTSGFGSASATWAEPTTGTATAGWSTSVTGVNVVLANSITTLINDPLHFGTDTNGLGGGTIAVSGTVDAASLRFGSQTTGNILLSGGTINLAATTSIHVGAGSPTVHTISSNITGAGTSLTKTGGSLTLSGANSYIGSTIISAGTLTLGSIGALGTTPGVSGTSGVTIGGASAATLASTLTGITIAAPITTANTGVNSAISFGNSVAAVGSLTLNGAIGGNGNVIFTTPNVSSGGNVQTINIGAAGNYAGSTTITTGNINNTTTVKAGTGVTNALPITTVLTMDGGNGPATANLRTSTYDVNGNNQTLAGLTNITGRVQRNQRVTNSGSLATLTIDNTVAYSYGSTVVDAATATATITGSLNLIKGGSAMQTLTGAANSYTGLTTVNGGALRIAHNGSLGTTAGGTVVNGSSSGSAANARLELSGGITVTGETLTINGAGNNIGALTSASGVNEWAGNVTIGSVGTRLGASTGATLKVSGVIDSGVVNTGINIRGSTLTSVVILSGANTYLGDTNVNFGKLQLDGGNDRLPVTTMLKMNSNGVSNPDAEFDLNGRNQEVAGLSLGGDALKNSVNNSSLTLSTLKVNTAAASPSTYAGLLTGNLALTKTGEDSLTLSGTNDYTGATTVSSGTLLINGNSSTTTGAVAVNGGTLGGTGRSGGAITVAGTATLSPGASIESLDVASLSMASTSVFAYEVADNTSTGADLLAARTTLSLTGVTLSLDAPSLAALGGGGWTLGNKLTLISYLGADVTSGFTGYVDDTNYTFGSNQWRFNYNDTVAGNNYDADAVAGGQDRFVTMTVVPEPDVAALLGGLGALALLRRRRNA